MRVFFDADDGLDISQLMLAVFNVFLFVYIALTGLNIWRVHESVLNAFLVCYGATFSLSAPHWIAKRYIDSKYFHRPSSEQAMKAEPDTL